MRILFDARAVQEVSDGLGNYVHHLLINLLRVDTTNRYVVLLTRAFHESLARTAFLEAPNFEPILTPTLFMGMAQHLQIPRLAWRLPAIDVYHYPHFDMPLLAHPRSVVTIHDLNQFTFPTYFRSHRALKRFYSFTATWLSVAKATHVIAVSDSTKQQLLTYFPWLDPQRLTVTHEGFPEAFLHVPAAEQLSAFREKYHLDHDRFILYVGTSRPHKNVERLLAAYALLRRGGHKSHTLLLVGLPKDDSRILQLINALGLKGDVRLLGYVPNEELPLAYRLAEAFVFCSLSEGFGVPLVEAMASGVPIVTSDRGAMAEVVGESAVLVNPDSVESIAEGLFMVLASEELRNTLARRGLERVKGFRWEEAARKTLEVYASVNHRASQPREA